MQNILRITALSCFLFLAACATSVPPEKIANADYGPPPTNNYQQAIKDAISPTLIDPTSPIYTFSGKPRKGYFKNSPALGTREGFGYISCGSVNAKNRMGGYTGGAPFAVLMRGDIVSQKILGQVVTDPGRLYVLNIGIDVTCSRNIVE